MITTFSYGDGEHGEETCMSQPCLRDSVQVFERQVKAANPHLANMADYCLIPHVLKICLAVQSLKGLKTYPYIFFYAYVSQTRILRRRG